MCPPITGMWFPLYCSAHKQKLTPPLPPESQPTPTDWMEHTPVEPQISHPSMFCNPRILRLQTMLKSCSLGRPAAGEFWGPFGTWTSRWLSDFLACILECRSLRHQVVFRSAFCIPAGAVALDTGVPGRSSEHSESLSRQEEVDSLGNGFAALGGEKPLLLGDIRHHLGDFI